MLIQTREQFDSAIKELMATSHLAIDTETTWTDHWDLRKLMGVAIANGENGNAYYFPFNHQHDPSLFPGNENLPIEWLQELGKVISRTGEDCPDLKIDYHTFKFDMQQFERVGIKCPGFVRDALLLSYFEDENRFPNHALQTLGKLVGEPKDRSSLKKIGDLLGGWHKIPPETMSIYACQDTIVTYKVCDYLWPLVMMKEGYEDLYLRAEKFARLLSKVETIGIRVDPEVATQLSEAAVESMQLALQEFGYDPLKKAQLARRLFSPAPEGLGFQPQEFSKLKSTEFSCGFLPKMDSKVLSRLDHPEVAKVLEYRSWLKANSTWYEGWFKFTDKDNRIHPHFKQHGTKTGRLSCEKPNFQQIPRDTEKSPVKSMLRATDGYELWEFDYSQIEFRLGVIYAEVPELLEMLLQGGDIHSLTAEKVGAETRQVGKTSNFLLIYTGGAEALKDALWREAKIDTPLEECLKIHKAFHKAYPGFKRAARKAEDVARHQGYVTYWNGRRRHFDRVHEMYRAYNSIVQGGAGEIMIESMLMLDDAGYRIVSQVHDSVWIEIPVGEVEVAVAKIKEIMEWPTEAIGLPFPVDAKRLA